MIPAKLFYYAPVGVFYAKFVIVIITRKKRICCTG